MSYSHSRMDVLELHFWSMLADAFATGRECRLSNPEILSLIGYAWKITPSSLLMYLNRQTAESSSSFTSYQKPFASTPVGLRSVAAHGLI
jgi:hypothetical protein